MAEKTAFERISEGAREALEIARGNQPAARVHMQGQTYVPEAELSALRRRMEELEAREIEHGFRLEAEEAKSEHWRAEAARLREALENIPSDVEAVAKAIYESWENVPTASSRTWEIYREKLPGGAEHFRKHARAALGRKA